MKKLSLIMLIIIFCSCNELSGYSKKYLVTKSDDNNWTTSAVIECDSVTMINRNKATLYIDGHKMNLEAQLIKIFSNPDFNK